ncbi:MAG: Dabb family protein [Clostridia bacterium]|nr:Dabb family protein [Clostridia bacterium]
MLKHVVCWKFKDENKEANMQKVKELLEALPAKIPFIRKLDVGVNVNTSDAATFDMALVTEFDSQADLNAYQIHPDHQAVSKFVSTVRTDRTVVDYYF